MMVYAFICHVVQQLLSLITAAKHMSEVFELGRFSVSDFSLQIFVDVLVVVLLSVCDDLENFLEKIQIEFASCKCLEKPHNQRSYDMEDIV